MSEVSGIGIRQRFTIRIASSSEFNFQIQYPETRSLVFENGPMVTARSFPENVTRAPLELDWTPAPSSITPASMSS